MTRRLDRATYVALMDSYDVEIVALQAEQRDLQRYADEYRCRGDALHLGFSLSALRAAEQAEDMLIARQRSASARHQLGRSLSAEERLTENA